MVSQNFSEAIGVLQAFQDLCSVPKSPIDPQSCTPSPHSPPVAASRGMPRVRRPSCTSEAADQKMCTLVHGPETLQPLDSRSARCENHRHCSISRSPKPHKVPQWSPDPFGLVTSIHIRGTGAVRAATSDALRNIRILPLQTAHVSHLPVDPYQSRNHKLPADFQALEIKPTELKACLHSSECEFQNQVVNIEKEVTSSDRENEP